MKNKLIRLLLAVIVIFAVSFSASAQVYVKIRPTFRVVQRPPQPSPNHVWIDEDWQPRGRNYRYSGGHWARPPHQGYQRNPGHWKNTRRGNVWIQGTWRRG